MAYFAIGDARLDCKPGHPVEGHLPAPKHGGATYSLQDVDSAESGRNQNGTMVRDRVAQKIKWQLSFPPLTSAEISSLLSAINGVTLSFTYPDPRTGLQSDAKTCYVGDRTSPLYSLINGVPMWEGLSFSIIEM